MVIIKVTTQGAAEHIFTKRTGIDPLAEEVQLPKAQEAGSVGLPTTMLKSWPNLLVDAISEMEKFDEDKARKRPGQPAKSQSFSELVDYTCTRLDVSRFELWKHKSFWKELKGLWAKGECGKFQACIEGILKRSPQQRPGVPPPRAEAESLRCLGGRAATCQGVQACGPKDEGCKTACDVEETEHDKLDQCAAKSCIEALSTEQSKHATRAKRPSRDKMRAD